MDDKLSSVSDTGPAESGAPLFEPPRVLSYRGDEIQQLLGPAQACSFHGTTICGNSIQDTIIKGMLDMPSSESSGQ